MKAIELKEEHPLIYKRIKYLADRFRGFDENEDLTLAFDWDEAPEGFDCWAEVYKYNYTLFYDTQY